MTLEVVRSLAWLLIALPIALFGYSYFVYPALLALAASARGRRRLGTHPDSPSAWPSISITIPAYNEEERIRDTIERVLAVPYPGDRRQVLIVSDASTDRTDEIVREFADRGVELLRLPQRSGKTAAENAAAAHLRNDIVVNMDATIRLAPDSLHALVAAFEDPTVGVASGRDVSVGDEAREGNRGESGYVGYEMWVRELETRVDGIVGASGCFYAIRRPLVHAAFPGELSRDFASPLIAREHGYRSVSVNEAVCYVPRTRSLQAEYRRKIRTMARGLGTLWFKSHLMNPLRYGAFAWMLVSHKLCRWLGLLTLPGILLGLALLALAQPWALVPLGVALGGIALGWVGLQWPEDRRVPTLFAFPGFVLASLLAALLAWGRALRGRHESIWEPTRRPA